jgi:pimeloyl-ACP methyl ester carboxylesterase
VLVVDDVGDPDGRVVVYLHGAPDCRLARHPDDGIAAALGIRLIAVDRPGYGGSAPLPEPNVAAFAHELGAALDQLGVGRAAAVAAWSAGAPWAFGAAAELGPERIDRVLTYAAIPPAEAYADPAVATASAARADTVADILAGLLSVDEVVDEWAMLLVPPPPVTLDVARAMVEETAGPDVARVPGLAETMARSLAAAVEWHGDAGLRTDLTMQLTPGAWAPALERIDVPATLVHGGHDHLAGPGVGTWLAERLGAGAEVVAWPDAGHQALLPRWREWLGHANPANPDRS